MLRTRLIVGTILAALTAGMLLLDQRFAPWFPFLFAVVIGLSVLGTIELCGLLPAGRRPPTGVCLVGVVVLLGLNWVPPLVSARGGRLGEGLVLVCQGMAAVVLAALLVEMARFRQPGGAVERLALTVWV